jgi:hypothetical protein
MSEQMRENLIELSLHEAPVESPWSKKFKFMCHGRDCQGNEILDTPVPVDLTFQQFPLKSSFATTVECKWITGSHRWRCMASHPGEEDHDIHGHKVECPYVNSIGWVEGAWKGAVPPARRDY